jgi:putative tributyrin esterase
MIRWFQRDISMAYAQVNWFSKTLAKMVAMNVILPEVGRGPYATFYLLHGLSDDYTAWQRRTRIEWYVRQLPLIVVMPDGGRQFYTDNADGPAYATFIAEELPAFIERTFAARSDRAGRCIGGLSMGGYGALRLALGYPDRYISAVSHSGAVTAWRWDPQTTALSNDEYRRIFGANAEGSNHDLIALAKKAKQRDVLPKLRIDCGLSDDLLPMNRELSATFKQMGIDHDYAEYPGDHNWDYWDLHVQEAIAFHAAAMEIAPIGVAER